MRYGAVVTAGVVENVVVLGDGDDLDTVASVHRAGVVVDVTTVEPRPGPGWSYIAGVFRPPAPFPSWVWMDGEWIAPVRMPDDGQTYVWDEDALAWVEVI